MIGHCNALDILKAESITLSTAFPQNAIPDDLLLARLGLLSLCLKRSELHVLALRVKGVQNNVGPLKFRSPGASLTRTFQCLPSAVVPEAKAFCKSVGAGHLLKVLQKLGVFLFDGDDLSQRRVP